MSGNDGKRRTDDELEELATAAFTHESEECEGLCTDLQDLEDKYDRLVTSGASQIELNAVLRQIRAIIARRRALHCQPCFPQ